MSITAHRPLRRTRILVPVAALAVVGSTLLAAPSSAAEPAAASSSITLKVMSQNIFYGGDDLDPYTETFCPVADGCPENLLRIEDVIRASGADVVGLQEAERNTDVIAKALGWYGSARDHVISRYPIVDPPDGDGVYVFVEPSPGRVVAVANVHMPSDPYGPFAVRDGATKAQLLELERTVRLPAIQTQLTVLPALAARGIPVFLTGDFNSPSALDWTAAVAAVRPDVHYPVKWPVSQALLDAGMRDSYREVHPDPVATPGFTWTPGSPEADPHEVFDRIDWVMHAGPSTALDSTVVGEVGDRDAGVQVSPYPSDHRGVVSTFSVRPAVSPGPRRGVDAAAVHRPGARRHLPRAGRRCRRCRGRAGPGGPRRRLRGAVPSDRGPQRRHRLVRPCAHGRTAAGRVRRGARRRVGSGALPYTAVGLPARHAREHQHRPVDLPGRPAHRGLLGPRAGHGPGLGRRLPLLPGRVRRQRRVPPVLVHAHRDPRQRGDRAGAGHVPGRDLVAAAAGDRTWCGCCTDDGYTSIAVSARFTVTG